MRKDEEVEFSALIPLSVFFRLLEKERCLNGDYRNMDIIILIGLINNV